MFEFSATRQSISNSNQVALAVQYEFSDDMTLVRSSQIFTTKTHRHHTTAQANGLSMFTTAKSLATDRGELFITYEWRSPGADLALSLSLSQQIESRRHSLAQRVSTSKATRHFRISLLALESNRLNARMADRSASLWTIDLLLRLSYLYGCV